MTQRIEFKVGLFITITSFLIMASIGYVAYKKGMFSKVYTYTLSSHTGENLTEGMPVAVWGFTIGRVSSLELNDQGTVLIRIKIPERHIRMIRADSKFVLDKPLIGSPRILVKTTNLNGLPLSPLTIPELTESNDINEIIKRAQPIIDKADRIMANIEGITANLADPKGDVNRILRDAEALVARFSKRDSLLEMVVGDPESVKSIHESLKKLRDITARRTVSSSGSMGWPSRRTVFSSGSMGWPVRPMRSSTAGTASCRSFGTSSATCLQNWQRSMPRSTTSTRSVPRRPIRRKI